MQISACRERSNEAESGWMQVPRWSSRWCDGARAHRWWTAPTRLVDVVGLAAESINCGSSGMAAAAIRHSAALAKAL